ncbi:MAG: hypothetical protein EHM58_02125 [Ignavibacteriae bacterium]|nr:MAG: hypothetical protein EHM58_02125 [Ignavibacteriota bacterium]
MEKALLRYSAMKKIDDDMCNEIDYGGPGIPLTKVHFNRQIDLCKHLLSEYNEILSKADEKAVKIKEAEGILSDMFTSVLAGAISRFGIDAHEINLLGGTRKSDRKKTVRKKEEI